MNYSTLRVLALVAGTAIQLAAQPPATGSAAATGKTPRPFDGAQPKVSPQPAANVTSAIVDRWKVIVEARELTRDGRFADAEARLEKLVVSRPGSAPQRLQLAELLSQVAVISRNEGDSAAAKTLGARALTLAEYGRDNWQESDRVRAARLSGDVAHHVLNDPKTAAKHYQEVIALDANNQDVKAVLARIETEEKNGKRHAAQAPVRK